MPPLSRKRKNWNAGAARATEGGRQKRAQLMTMQLELREQENQVENQSENMMTGPNQHDPGVSPNQGTKPSPPPNVPPLAPGADPGVDKDLGSKDPPNEDLKSACNRAPTTKEAVYARDQVDAATRTPCCSGGHIYADLDPTTRRRFNAMEACLNHYIRSGSKNFFAASTRAADGQNMGAYYARIIHRWIRVLIDTGDLPYYEHGWWNVLMLEDEDIVWEIKAHLESVGKYAGAEAVVEFLSRPETRARLGIPKTVSLRTAQQWMQRCGGFCWCKTPKGQYFDGHKRADVVEYRQKVFLPFWRELERRRIIYNKNGEPDPNHPMNLQPGKKPVIIWFHDESIFFAYNRQLVRWVGEKEHAKPFKKGDGNTIMVGNFVCAEFGWLKGKNRKSARVIFRPGVNQDGYFTCDQVIEQLKNAIEIVKEAYPEYTHVFIYDNAPLHTKRPEDAITARRMPKKLVPEFPRPVLKKGKKVPATRMEPGRLPDGRAQSFYFPDDHPNNKGWFKGMAEILRERGLGHIAEKPAECRDFKCEEGRTDCCCRRALFCQPNFEARDSTLEETARKLGTQVVFLPKYHCELNPIKQCWGYAKRKYRDMPETNKESVMKQYVIDAVDSVPLLSIRKFAARSQRFIDAYVNNKSGPDAIEWATKTFRSHRQTPAHLTFDQI